MRLILFVSIQIALAIAVYHGTDSFLFPVLAVVLFIVIWLISANIKSIYNGKNFKHEIEKFSVHVAFPNSELYAEGYMYLRNTVNVVGVTVNANGIYLYSFGVLECLLAWDVVSNIKHKSIAGKDVVEIKLVRRTDVLRDFAIPWRGEFDDFIPRPAII